MVVDIHVEEQFKGPMDLLLYLIKRDEVDIADIPISHITNEYMKALNAMPVVDVDLGGEFATMASMLMEIKAKLMLPPEEIEDDDEVVELDPRAGLVEALLEYKKFKEAAGELDHMMDNHAQRHPRVAPNLAKVEEKTPEEEKIDANIYELFGRMAKLMRETLAQTAATTIVATEISTEDCIDSIIDKIKIKGRVGFKELLSKAASREEMVVFFIAILELVRLHEVVPFQAEDFSEIYLERPGQSDHAIPIEKAAGFRRLRPLGAQLAKVARILHLPVKGPTQPAPRTPLRPFLAPLPVRKAMPQTNIKRPFMPLPGRRLGTADKARTLPGFPHHLPERSVTPHDFLLSAMLRGLATEFASSPKNRKKVRVPKKLTPTQLTLPLIWVTTEEDILAGVALTVAKAGREPDTIFGADEEEQRTAMLRSFFTAYLALTPTGGGETASALSVCHKAAAVAFTNPALTESPHRD